MLAATQDSRPLSAILRWYSLLPLCTLGALAFGMLAVPPPAKAEGPPRPNGLLVSVPNPIEQPTVRQIRNQIEDAFRTNPGGIKKIIFDFNPVKGRAATTDFYSCLGLANYLLGVKNRARTVAFVHGEVMRHTVLPVLACDDLIMADNSVIGDVRGNPPEFLDDTIEFAYRKYARLKNPDSPDLVLKMLDKNMEVWQSKTGNPVRYVDRKKLKEGERERFKETSIPSLQRGSVSYTTEDARKCELCWSNRNTLKEVAYAVGLSESSLRQGITPGAKNVWLIEFSTPVSAASVSSVRRKMDKAIAKGATLIILQLEGEGGDTVEANDFATKYLRNLKDDRGNNRVETIAYVPPGRKLEATTAIALGCTEIVMGKDSVLCNFVNAKAGKKGEAGDNFAMVQKTLAELAEKQKYSPLLIQGALDPNLEINLVKSKADPTNHFLVSKEEFEADQERPADKRSLILVKPVKRKGTFLELTAENAYKPAYGLTRMNPDEVEDYRAVCRKYGIDPDKVQKAGSDVLDEIEMFFRKPVVSFMLIMIGIIGLILEMKMPGVGLPGVIAAVCFVLYFWANSSVGEFWWLAILLFILGLILIGLEVFFLPGMAVFGISGVVLVVTSLVLVTLEKAPSTTAEWLDLGRTLSWYTLGLAAGIACAFLIARYLPQIPYANRLVLLPPTDRPEPQGDESAGSSGAAPAALLGAIGEAATNLRPAGKARFGDDFLDVVAEGSYVNAGKRVQVIEIEGNRIVVKEV
jgi:membrane-bound ClpP family serine protease